MTDGSDPARSDEQAERAVRGLQSSTRDPDELRSSIEAWLRRDDPDACVTSLEMPEKTGISSLTVMLDVAHGTGSTERLVARVVPDSSAVPVFPNYDLEKQYLVLEHLGRNSPVPVPRVHSLVTDLSVLGVPFFTMDRVEGEIPPDVMPYPFGSFVTEASRSEQRRMQESAIAVLAEVHRVQVPESLRARLEFNNGGKTALRRHFAEQRAYYEWCTADGVRSSVLEACLDWLEDNWPAEQAEDDLLSWGDARIGNMIFKDFSPVAILDFEMVGLAPREVDLGWMVYLHRWFDDIASSLGVAPMSHFMRVPDSVATYESSSGHQVRDFRWYLLYAALRHGIIMFRVSRRPIAFGQAEMPADPNDLIMHKVTLEKMISGEYWAGFDA